ncbi:MAG: type IV pilus modification protein PilV [Desulfobulbaceae bacterium]|nr:type IV pilus modification protein PilV [Desulfobulbaceae bacterium]
MKKSCSNQEGFTLIEALIAMVVLTIGILTLITMQTTSIKGNAKARNLTTASAWGQDRIERLFAMDYDDVADGTATSPDGHYTISWTVADDILASVPDQPLKQITVSIVRNDFGAQRTVDFNYYRQKIY